MEVTESGIVTDVRDVLPEKAEFPIFATEFPIAETGTSTAVEEEPVGPVAFTEKALRLLPMAPVAGVQKALFVESITALVSAANAVALAESAPIFKLPDVTL